MSTPELIFWLILAVFGIFDSALWSGLETATYVVGRARLEARAAKPAPDHAARRLKAELDRPERILTSLLVMNNISNYIGVLALSKLLDATGLPTWQISVINAAVLTPTLFVFAETLPKEYFRIHAERLAYAFSPLLKTVRIVLTVTLVLPVVVLVAKLVQRIVGAKTGQAPLDPRERMVWLVREAVGQGIVSKTQAEIASRAIAFRDTPLREEMTPWNRVTRLRSDSSYQDARRAVLGSTHSRLPVVGSRGGLVGVVDAVDILLSDENELKPLLREAISIDASLSAREALQALRSAGETLAVVVCKERPIGLVTMKDLVEPVTGELIEW
ncbi:MAG: DUF21 domain-containing protein [Phycisphaera sp.]|nr:MAG: DUF21 domain-containing protein [Phycisphaera sp.]